MKRVLIVSPHFPPINAADHQRARIAIPFLPQHGWQPVVLAVAPEFVEAPRDEWLLRTLPDNLEVHRSRALPVSWTRRLGMSTLGPRCRGHLKKLGDRILQQGDIDLVYFSTTQFPVLRLGPEWRRRHGVPYVVDLQDPWVNDYYRQHPEVRPPGGRLKYAFASAAARRDEYRCLRDAGAVTVVSPKYTADLQQRYSDLNTSRFTTLPFGASERDFQLAGAHPVPQSYINFDDGHQHWVSVGRGGDDLRFSLQSLFRAFRQGLETLPELRNVRMHFLGTDYAASDRVRPTVSPIAAEEGVGEFVSERPQRIPYSETLACLRRADRLLICGSNDRGYNPSKVGVSLLSGRPILAILHQESPAADPLRQAGQECVTFAREDEDLTAAIQAAWNRIPQPSTCPPELTAARMTHTLAHVFDQALTS